MTQNIWHTNRESENKNSSQNRWIAEGERAKTSSLEIIPSNKTVTGGADLVTLDTRIQGRIRVHTRTRGHDLWKPLDIKEVWEYINKSPWCKALSITDSHTLYYTIIHFLKERNSTSSQCSDCQSPRVITSSHKTSDMHDLSMIFDQQDLFTTNGAIDCYNCLDVISFSRTFNDFTFKLSTGFSSWNTRSFTKISTTTTSAWTQDRVLSVSWSCQR